jgi:GNAT superfamily N-acetyltransferase
MALAVREIGQEEWARFRDLRLRALADAPTAFASTYEGEAAQPESWWRDRLRRSDSTLFAALDGDRWIGIAGVVVAEEAPTSAHLISMWVDPRVRRRGAGGQLVDAVAAWARDRGLHGVDLWVTETNEPARRFYASCGFVEGAGRQPLPSNPDLSELALHMDLL